MFPKKEHMEWISCIQAIPPVLRRFIGVLEVLAALYLILPQLISVLPWLTSLTAAGLAIIMALATVFHLQRKEYTNIPFNLALLVMSAFVAYSRLVS